MPRYKTVKDARLALWRRVLEEYDELVEYTPAARPSQFTTPPDLADAGSEDEEFMKIAMAHIRTLLKQHALLV